LRTVLGTGCFTNKAIQISRQRENSTPRIPIWRYHKEKQNVIGNYIIDHCGIDADRGDSGLAKQQIVGLRPERRARAGIGHPAHPVAAG